MGRDTSIGWTATIMPDGTRKPGFTFNPWIGCEKIAPGCKFCYAKADMDDRRHRAQWGSLAAGGTRALTADSYWKDPIKWNKEAERRGVRFKVFCSSLADVFEDWKGPIVRNRWIKPVLEPAFIQQHEVWIAPSEPDRFVEKHGELTEQELANVAAGLYRPATMADVRASLFRLIDKTPFLDWLLLTKRPENIRRFWPDSHRAPTDADYRGWGGDGPIDSVAFKARRENVWLGASVSEQETWDRNVPLLAQCRDLGKYLFISGEPLLGPIDVEYPTTVYPDGPPTCCSGMDCGCRGGPTEPPMCYDIDWMILGAESGVERRKCDPAWAQAINRQLEDCGKPVFNKQYEYKGGIVSNAKLFPRGLEAQDFPGMKRAEPPVPGNRMGLFNEEDL